MGNHLRRVSSLKHRGLMGSDPPSAAGTNRSSGRIDRFLWCVDGSVVHAHRAAARALLRSGGSELQALGKSKRGVSTKIHVVTDAKDNLLSVTAAPGKCRKESEFPHVMRNFAVSFETRVQRPNAATGDNEESSRAIREWLTKRSIKVVIPKRSNEHRNGRFSATLYRRRNIVERTIGHLKKFRRVATRFNKHAKNHIAFIKIAATRIMLKTFNQQSLGRGRIVTSHEGPSGFCTRSDRPFGNQVVRFSLPHGLKIESHITPLSTAT